MANPPKKSSPKKRRPLRPKPSGKTASTSAKTSPSAAAERTAAPNRAHRKGPRGKPQPRRRPNHVATQGPATPTSDAADAAPLGDRLQKVLASAGIASRRECERLISEGRVEVDGKVVDELGVRVDRRRQQIRVDGEPIATPRLVYYAVHKPTGVVSTSHDPAGRPRVIDMLPRSAGRVFCVGRLDLASEGLILVTNDGELAAQLTHPRHRVEKTYAVQVAGMPENDVLAQLRRGVHLAEGFAQALDVRVKSRKKNSAILEMVLDEGRNREIRRLLARIGHKVQRLTRIAVGPLRLGDLPRGAVRQLTSEEVRKLRQSVDRQGPHRTARQRAEIQARERAELQTKSNDSPPIQAAASPQKSPRRFDRRETSSNKASSRRSSGARSRKGKGAPPDSRGAQRGKRPGGAGPGKKQSGR